MSSKSEKLNWGLVGLGNISSKFAEDLLLTDESIILAAASKSEDRAHAFCKKNGIERAYGGYDNLLQDHDIDVVYIGTPHDSHSRLSIQAMEAGKHVLCEKPLAVNSNQVRQMIETSKRQGVFLMEALWSKFNPTIKECLKLVKKGEIGEVNYINADFSFLGDPSPEDRLLNKKLAGGALLDVGIYPLFLAYSVFGKPLEMKALARFHQTGADIQTAVILKYDMGMALLMGGFVSQSDMVAKMYGTNGSLFIHGNWHQAQGYTLVKNGKSKVNNLPTMGRGFTYEIKETVECIRKGQIESQYWSHRDSLELMNLMDKIRSEIGLRYPIE